MNASTKIKRNVRKVRYVLYRETLIDSKEHLFTFLGAFVGIALIGLLQRSVMLSADNLFMIGSFGASAVLIFGIANSPLAQPRNLIGGHLVSAIIGVTVQKFVPAETWFQAALAVSLSVVGMQITKTLHPPGGATALITNIGSEKIKAMGYSFVWSPVMSGVMILFLIAMICNNISPGRSYPSRQFKLFTKKK